MNTDKQIKQAMQYAMAEHWDEAKHLIRQVIESSPEDLWAKVVQADIENISGNEKEAFQQLRILMRNYPEFAPAYYSMGILHSRQGRWDQAKNFFEQSISLFDPGQKESLSDAYLQLGIAWWEQRHPGDALECWQKSLACNPAQWKAREYLEDFTSDYSKPKILGDPRFFQQFQEIHVKAYLSEHGKSQFDSLEETDEVIQKIAASWNAIPEKWKMEDLTEEERFNTFKSIKPFQ
ncbi:MAG: tetratricopeptide repeat protein [Nitrospirae bacterium]|nr:tetratricopeptide repeat protein [Nitrospirota bacterium]